MEDSNNLNNTDIHFYFEIRLLLYCILNPEQSDFPYIENLELTEQNLLIISTHLEI